jgi:soluble lytic murein transglycosylase-like protein
MLPQIYKKENLYDDLIIKYANKYGIDPALLKAIITIESAFYEKSYRYEPHRNDSSYGLVQILYQTAKNLGFKGKPTDLYDPETNINYGAKFLSILQKQYKNIDDVIASYNMGYPRPASKTTPIIINIYGKPKPDWKYANQPYVDKGLAYYYYYKAKFNNDLAKANLYRDLIWKQKHKEVIKLEEKGKFFKWLPLIFTLIPFSLIFLIKSKSK